MSAKLLLGCALLASGCRETPPIQVDTSQRQTVAPTQHEARSDSVVGLPLRRTTGVAELPAAESLFKAAGSARGADLAGVWLQVRHVIARRGQPAVVYVVDSLRTDSSARPSWTLRFDGGPRFIVNVGSGPEEVALRFDARGDLRLSPNFEADNAPTYSCRLLGANRMICFDTEHREESFEFERRPGR
jgi:hypothetical protein